MSLFEQPPHTIALVFITVVSSCVLVYKLCSEWWTERTTENERQQQEREALAARLQKATELELHQKIRDLEEQNDSLRDEVRRLSARLIFATNELRSDPNAETQCMPPPSRPGRWLR